MRILTLKADDGQVLKGKLADDWSEVPLGLYAQLAAAETLPQRLEALAALVGLPAQPLLDDVSLGAALFEAAPWLEAGLPDATGAVPTFNHLGTHYAHVGALDRVSAGQMEALLDFLAASDGMPLGSAPGLLAVLYCPQGKEQTREVVRASVAAFASLPMSVAWPALQDFIGSSGSVASRILTVSALSEQTLAALDQLETSLAQAGTSGTFWQKLLRSRVRTWLRNARVQLTTF